MSTKPSTVPGFHPTTSGAIVEPSSAKKLAGWTTGERPPAQFFNWFWDSVSSWIDYLDGLLANDNTWTGPNWFTTEDTHVSEVLRLGLDPDDNVTAGAQERLAVELEVGGDTQSDKTRAFRFNTGAKRVELWVDRAFNAELVVNATWSNTTDKWTKHVNGAEAYLLRLGMTSGLVFAVKSAAQDTAWSNSLGVSGGWTTESLAYYAASQAIQIPTLLVNTLTSLTPIAITQHLSMTGTDAAQNDALSNTLAPGLVLKSWARFTTTAGAVTISDGRNVESITRSGNNLTYTFPTGGEMSGAYSYAPSITCENFICVPIMSARAASSFTFHLVATSTDTTLDIASNNVAVSVTIAGAQ